MSVRLSRLVDPWFRELAVSRTCGACSVPVLFCDVPCRNEQKSAQNTLQQEHLCFRRPIQWLRLRTRCLTDMR